MARSRRFRRTLIAAVAAPLVALPVVAPAVAAATAADAPTAVDARGYGYGYGDEGGYGSYGGYDGGYGSYGGDGSYGYGYGYGTSPYSGGSGGYGSEGSTGTTTDTEPATAKESTGVVLINTTIDYGTAEAAGTGLVLTSDGIVVTNHHVVEGATKIEVTDPSTDKTYDATVLGYDSVHDVAVLQLDDASGLSTVTTDRTDATSGEEITSVGNAEGQGSLTAADGTVTDASTAITVSEDDGSSARLTDLIEVDADVVSGDSGGALLDSDGEVIGMNVAASSGSADISGYAIPIDTVLDIAAKIIAGKETGDIELGYAAALGVELSDSSTTQVAGVVDDSGAEAAGITAGSTITSLDGTTVSTLDDLTTILDKHDPGDKVRVTWTDSSGASHTATVTLGKGPVG